MSERDFDKLRLIFMGTPEFAVPSLKILSLSGFQPVAVVTGPDKQRGRGRKVTPTAVKSAALSLGIETILQPNSVKYPDFAEEVTALRPDIIVVVAFRILPPSVFGAARLGAFNLHASLLPRYRGAAPIQRALMGGDTETGVTTFFLQRTVDTGNMILQWPTRVGPEENFGVLHDRMKLLGARAVLETTRRIAAGRAHTTAQDNRLATPAPKIRKEDCLISWKDDALSVHNHCRGLSPFPGAWTRHQDQRLKILSTSVVSGSAAPGTILEADQRLVIACGQDALEILELQQQSRRRMKTVNFLRGYTFRCGDTFY